MIFKIFLCLSFIFTIKELCAQTEKNIQNTVFKNYFEDYELPKKNIRSWMKNTSSKAKLNPMNYVFGGLLFTYQNIISEQIQANCQYETSCSENMKLSIQKLGLIGGFFSGLNQLSNCFYAVKYDYPPFKINKNDKIINILE